MDIRLIIGARGITPSISIIALTVRDITAAMAAPVMMAHDITADGVIVDLVGITEAGGDGKVC